MRYPQHLVTDYFKEQTLAPSYYWVNIWVQNYMHQTYTQSPTIAKHLRSVMITFIPVKWSHMQPLSKVREVTIWNINFIRKERVYTKLKYSRTPSYDIVSAGVAALFAGLLGFLICEKFGFELLDGGDFLFLFIYVVGLSFSIKLLMSFYANTFLGTLRLLILSVFIWFKWFVHVFYQSVKYEDTDDEDSE